MSSRAVRLLRRLIWREQQVAETQNGHQETVQAPLVPEIEVSPPPSTIDLDPIDNDDDDDDDVVELTASAFAEANTKSLGARRRGPLVVDVESGGTTRLSKTRKRACTNQANDECDEPNKLRKTVVEEPKFNCPICLCPFTDEVSTKCGHIFCSGCIKTAISGQAKCPTCRKKVKAKELIRVFLPAAQ
ncbi:unnamed protein product [Cochlearia groenlandica]